MSIALTAKMKATSAAASVTGFITYLLVTFVPSFHHGLPTNVATLLPYVVAVVLGVAAGWLKKETKAIGVGEDWITRGEAVLNRLEAAAVEAENIVNGLANVPAPVPAPAVKVVKPVPPKPPTTTTRTTGL